MRKTILLLCFFIQSSNIFSSNIKPVPEQESLFETPGYNHALIILGFIGVTFTIGGFAYLLTKKKL